MYKIPLDQIITEAIFAVLKTKRKTQVCLIANGDSTQLLADKLRELNIPFYIAKNPQTNYHKKNEYEIDLTQIKVI